jgi:PAS domain S-box-containing protein
MKISFQSGNWINAILYTAPYLIAIIVTFSRFIPFKIRVWSGVFVYYAIGLISLITVGPQGSGRVWLFAFTILTCLLLGLRPGLIAVLINVCSISILALFIDTGYFKLTYLDYSHSDYWVATCLSFLFLNTVITVSLGVLVSALEKNLQKEQLLTRDLKLSNEQLERENTERRQAEESLRKSQERFRIVSELTSDFSYGIRVESNETLSLDWVTEAISRITGFHPDELSLTDGWTGLIHPEDRYIKRHQIQTLLSGHPSIVEYRILTKNGPIRWLLDYSYPVWSEDRGRVTKIYGAVQDITERKQSENALEESEEKYKTLTNNLHVGIYRNTGGPEGKFLEVNPAIMEMFGYKSRKDIFKIKVSDLYQNADERTAFNQKMNQKGYVRNEELHLKCRDGTPIICSVSAVAVKDENGKLKYYDGIIEDITERKKLESQFRQAQKLEAIGTLAGGIAHDFNNLLMTIQGNVSLMLFDIDSVNPNYSNLVSIEKQIQKGADLTRQLLGYARKGKYQVEPADLNQIVEETSQAFGRTRKQISIESTLSGNLPAIEADRGQIEQVLLNILINAADAMPSGGKLIIKTSNVNYETIKGRLYKAIPGRYVQLMISDTGTGMDKRTQERIFEPFFTTKEFGKGTGLGLASAYGIVKSHGGYIDVESTPNLGTTFFIYLPASEQKVHHMNETDHSVVEGSGNILLVDDEEMILKVGVSLLDRLGYSTLKAHNGWEAIEIFSKQNNDIDLVILDLIMPEIGGGDVYEKLKDIDPKVKVLLSSGYSIDGQANEILERGCNGFIQKPFSIKELSEKINEILVAESASMSRH